MLLFEILVSITKKSTVRGDGQCKPISDVNFQAEKD